MARSTTQFINPCQGLTPLSLLNKFRSRKSSSQSQTSLPITESPPNIDPEAIPSIKEDLALNGCYRCGEMAVCALDAREHDLFPGDENENLISTPEIHPQSIIANFEQQKYMNNRPQRALKKEEQRAILKLWTARKDQDLEKGPFCCGKLKILERESTMSNTDPDYLPVKTLFDRVSDPQRMKINLNVVKRHQLNAVTTVYKINVYGRHVPLDAHSTWLFTVDPDDRDIGGPVFYGFVYCEKLQPFSSVKRYITLGCMGEHKRSRYYRVGAYEASGFWEGDDWVGVTFGDKNMDMTLRMPGRKRIRREHTTLDGVFQDLVLEQENIENGL